MTPAPRAPDHPLAGLLTLMWHYVRDEATLPHVGTGWLDTEAFDRQLALIARRRTVVDWPSVVAALESGVPLPPRATLLTFDDGLADHHRVVMPRLARRGWSGVFFVMARPRGERLSVGHKIHILLADMSPRELRTEVLERLTPLDRSRFLAAETREREARVDRIDVLKRPLQRDVSEAVGPILSTMIEERHGPEAAIADELHLDDDQIDEMREAGMTIGGHGRRHLWFDWAADDDVEAEIGDSARFLSGDPTPHPFAYPYGAGTPVASALLERDGFGAAFLARPSRSGGRYDIGRLDAEAPGFEAALGPRER